MNVYICNPKLNSTAWILAVSMMACGCNKEEPDKPAPKSADKVLKIAVPENVRRLWKEWNGRYVVFVHRNNPVRQLSDFSGRKITCAMIETDSIIGDVTKLCEAGEIQDRQIAIQNNPDVYDKNLLETPTAIGVMVPAVAEHYKFHDNPKLIEVVIE